MGLLKGILLGLPVGLYFGERALNFPLVITHQPNNNNLHFSFDYSFLSHLFKDAQSLFDNSSSSTNTTTNRK
jgi:hypothetical protein